MTSIVCCVLDWIQVTLPNCSTSDADIVAALLEHLGLDARDRLPSTSYDRKGAGPGAADGAGGSGGGGGDTSTVEAFVELSRKLIEMERAAEVAQATEETSMYSPETAQVRGRTD